MKTSKLLSKANCFYILFIIVLATACSKNETVKKSNTELLTQRAWSYEGYGLDVNNNGIIDPSEEDMVACQSDDAYTFSADGSGLLTGGATKCDLNEPDSQGFTWAFSNNESQLVVNSFAQMISLLDENTLEVYFEDQNSQGQTVKYIFRYKH